VLSLHPDTEWLHIGCDEVYQLGQCSKCSERIAEANSKPDSTAYFDGKTLFLEHVHRIATYVREKSSVTPIIWDDMLRTIPLQTIQNSGIGSLVEPMIWVYVEDIDRFIDSVTWSAYGAAFEHLWSASAYKGAFGERMFSVNVQRHVANHLSWLEVMNRESRGNARINFRGIALTGWSRYDHFAVICELLPAALPSLVLNLAIVSRGGHDFEAVKRAHRILQCGSQKALMTSEELRRNPLQW
jgi:hexosaminidase